MMDELEQQVTQPEAGETAPELTETEALAQQLAECEEKHLRLRAEYDNFRKRSQKERETIYSLALAEAAGAFIPVLDNLERACTAPGADEGVKMILKQLFDIFGKMDIRAVGESGERFDPNLHNAVAHEGEGGADVSVISDVLQKGYIMGDRLIRPAMVKTANALPQQ